MKKQLAFTQFYAALGRKGALALCLALCMLGLGLSVNAEHGKAGITTFDVGGAGTGAGQGTQPLAINPAGAITGLFCDPSTCHGFVRAPDGDITPFDVQGATGTAAESINPAGTITGEFWDSSGVYHGYLRAPDGNITPFDARGRARSPPPFRAPTRPASTPAGGSRDTS